MDTTQPVAGDPIPRDHVLPMFADSDHSASTKHDRPQKRKKPQRKKQSDYQRVRYAC